MFSNLSKVTKILSAQMGIKFKYLCSKTDAISPTNRCTNTTKHNYYNEFKLWPSIESNFSCCSLSHLLLFTVLVIIHFILIWVIICLMSNTPPPIHTHGGPCPLWTGTIFLFPILYIQCPTQST